MLDSDDLRSSIGAQRLREGFARTPEMDLWWACGFPDLVLGGGPSPKKGAMAWLKARDGLHMLPGRWPDEVLHMVVHNAADPTPVNFRAKQAELRASLDALLQAALDRGPADEDVVRAALDRAMEPASRHFEVVYPAEALIGTAKAVDHLLNRIEAVDPDEMSRMKAGRGAIILHMAPMLWRLSPAEHAAVRARLEALFARLSAARGEGSGYARRARTSIRQCMTTALDLVLNGSEAAASLLPRNPPHATLVADPQFLTGLFVGLAGEKWTDVAPGAAFYAPEAVLTHYTHHWDEYTRKEQQLELVEALSTLADERILPWMLEMAGGSKVKPQASQWFVDHRDETASFIISVCEDTRHRWGGTAAKLAKKMKL